MNWIVLSNPILYDNFEETIKVYKTLGYKILVDMKWCDIPYIMSLVCKVLREKGVDGVTFHEFCGSIKDVDSHGLEIFIYPAKDTKVK